MTCVFKIGDSVALSFPEHVEESVLLWKSGDRGIVEAVSSKYVSLRMERNNMVVSWPPTFLENVQTKQEPRVLPDITEVRENYPLWDGLFAYFPAALCEVARWSKAGNDKHNPGEPLHWSREKSTDHKNKILRHLLDSEKKVDGDFYEATALAWRSLALLQELLEKDGWPEGENAKRSGP